MIERKQWLLATASTVAFTGAANAQPLQSHDPSITNWTGWYAGLNLSATRHHATTTDVDGWGRTALGPGNPPYVTPFFESRKTGIGFGGQVGYNWQVDRWVAGVEGDIGYVGAKKTFTPGSSFTACGTACTVSATNELTWLATFRGRAGVTFNSVLFYGTAGVALGGIQNNWGYGDAARVGIGSFSDSQFKVDHVRAGFVYGGGVEWAATQHWLVRAEMMHADLGTSSATISGPSLWAPAGTYTSRFKNTATFGRAALSYRW
jgi:outer membrane immunogenic protein